MSTYSEILNVAAESLRESGNENARRDARLLLCYAAGFSTVELISSENDSIPQHVLHTFTDAIRRRQAREPVSRIIGNREFWGRCFTITPDVLDPRPDTETLVSLALDWLPTGPVNILDLGVGSGCILLTLLSERPEAQGIGVDESQSALDVAMQNAAALGVDSRANFIESNWFSNVPQAALFDLIVSNPPYIPSPDIDALEADVRNYDPIGALDGGDDGLDDYRVIIASARSMLKPDGGVVFEVGFDQADKVLKLLDEAGFAATGFCKDLSGIKRVVYGRAPSV